MYFWYYYFSYPFFKVNISSSVSSRNHRLPVLFFGPDCALKFWDHSNLEICFVNIDSSGVTGWCIQARFHAFRVPGFLAFLSFIIIPVFDSMSVWVLKVILFVPSLLIVLALHDWTRLPAPIEVKCLFVFFFSNLFNDALMIFQYFHGFLFFLICLFDHYWCLIHSNFMSQLIHCASSDDFSSKKSSEEIIVFRWNIFMESHLKKKN